MKLAIGIAIAAAIAAAAAAQENEVKSIDRTRFLFAAVSEGLAEDGFDPKLAGEIIESARKWFVKKCPVCDAVRLGFIAYKASCDQWPSKGDPWSGSRVPEETMKKLKSEDTATRHKAFESLVSKYVRARFDRFKMTPEQRDRMQELLKVGMKEGLESLKQSGQEAQFPESCPSCEGAN